MKIFFKSAAQTTIWPVSILTVAICLLLNINAIAQAPPPTDPYVANVTSFGATGNDGTDDTQAIQNAIDWLVANHPGGTVLVPDGTYMLNAVQNSLLLKSNMTFRMTSGAILYVITNNQDSYELIRTNGASNLNIIGGTLQGDRYRNSVTPSGNWGMGINIMGSTNVYIQGVTSKDMWGDGFYVGGMSRNITFCGVVADNNRRQGLSITLADGVVVKNSVFKNTNGADPQFGIDLEPNPNNIVNNINISTSQFSGNHNNGGIQLWPNLPYNCILTNVVINGIAQPDNVQSSIKDANATRTVGSCGTPTPTLTVNPAKSVFGNVTVNTTSAEQTCLLKFKWI